jgi:hypothetical protein
LEATGLVKGPDRPIPRLTNHPDAWLFRHESDPHKAFEQVMSEVLSGSFPTTEHMRQWIRQAGLVSLFFFLKGICAYNQAYDKLTTELHLDMANFVQLMMEKPGSKALCLIARFHFKSTINSHGKISWTLLRDPNRIVALGSNIEDRSQEFFRVTKDTFQHNEFVRWLYPDHCVTSPSQPRFNDREIVMPNRTIRRPEPSLRYFAVLGSTQGIHADDLNLDDPVGDKQLDGNREATAEMLRIGNWLKTNIRTLVMDWNHSQVFMSGTRYGMEDPYEHILTSNSSAFYGCKEELYAEDYHEVEDGEWDVYYRLVEEDGQFIFPERMNRRAMDQIEKDDPWTAITQFRNKARVPGLSEFIDYRLGDAWLDWDVGANQWKLTLVEIGEHVIEHVFFWHELDRVVACDPAASDKKMSARTSRSAVVMYVQTPLGHRVICDLRYGYVRTTEMFNWMFDFYDKYRPRVTVLETIGPFKTLKDSIREEELRRKKFISLMPESTPSGDKTVNIRTTLTSLFSNGLVYCVKPHDVPVLGEMRGFPGSKLKDILDSITLAEKKSYRPPSKEELDEAEDVEEETIQERSPITGY